MPRAGKQGKGNRPAPVYADRLRLYHGMSKEEYEAWQQLRKKMAAETYRLLQEHSTREAEFSKENKTKIMNSWRKIMRLSKTEQLRRAVETLAQVHERDVDRKDAMLQMLDKDIDEAEEQFQIAMRSHLQDVDRLIDLQDARLLAMESEFANDTERLEAEYAEDRSKLDDVHSSNVLALKHVIAAVGHQEDEKLRDVQSKHEQAREEINGDNLERVHYLQSVLDSKIEELEQAFEQAHIDYVSSTDQRTQDYKALMARGQKMAHSIEQKKKRIRVLKRELQRWKVKLMNNEREEGERNTCMERERQTMAKHLNVLKGRLNVKRKASTARLTTLSTHALQAKGEMGTRTRMVERVLNIAERCRALESDKEKVMPFHVTTRGVYAGAGESKDGEGKGEERMSEAARLEVELRAQAEEEMLEIANSAPALASTPILGEPEGRGRHQPTTTDDSGELVTELQSLDKFYSRMNRTLLEKLALQRQKDELEEENRELQNVLSQYLEGIAVTERALEGANPLLVVNGQVELNRPPVRVRPGDVAHVEAAHLDVSAAKMRVPVRF